MMSNKNFKYPNTIRWPELVNFLKVGDILKGPDGQKYVISQVIPSTFQEYPSLLIKKLEDE